MRVGFDVDGVLYRMTKAYHQWMNTTAGMSLDLEEEAQTWDWYDQWETLEQFHQNLHDGVDARQMYWEGELYEPSIAQDLLRLRTAGHTIHVVTARFYGKLECPQEATRYWFSNNRLIYDTMDFSKDKKMCLPDVFIEDNLDNYDALEAAGVRAYLINRRYNLRNDTRRRVNSVHEYVNDVLELENAVSL